MLANRNKKELRHSRIGMSWQRHNKKLLTCRKSSASESNRLRKQISSTKQRLKIGNDSSKTLKTIWIDCCNKMLSSKLKNKNCRNSFRRIRHVQTKVKAYWHPRMSGCMVRLAVCRKDWVPFRDQAVTWNNKILGWDKSIAYRTMRGWIWQIEFRKYRKNLNNLEQKMQFCWLVLMKPKLK